jgi:hypothetical protein
MMYFLSPEPREEPEMKRLASKDKNKEVRVVILTYSAMDPQYEFIQADRQITLKLGRELTKLFQENEEKVTIVPPRLVEEYKNTHPSKHGLDPLEVGQHFKADYVIYLELNKLSLYEQGAGNQLLRGRADISVSLVDVHHPDDPEEPHSFTCVYPGDSCGAQDVSPENTPVSFREKFLAHVAKRLSYYFAPHPKRDREVQVDY